MIKKFGICIILSWCFCLSQNILAESHIKGRWALGLTYPGISIRRGLLDWMAVDLHGQFGSEIYLLGPRLSFYLNPSSQLIVYLAGEGNWVSFKGEKTEGWGVTSGGFLGLEFFLNKRISLATEIGLGLIYLENTKPEGGDTFRWCGVYNVSLYFHTLSTKKISREDEEKIKQEGKRTEELRKELKKRKEIKVEGEEKIKEKINIAVADFEAVEVSRSDAIFVAEFVREALVNSKVFKVAERRDVDKVMEELGFQMSGCTDEQCAVQIGRLLNVHKMVLGRVGTLMGKYQISIRVVDVETSEIVFNKTKGAKDPDEMKIVAEEIVNDIIYEIDK
ncbi:MAG: CsgG/HfaB family protein [Elusimicrobiota bacterium]